MNIETLIKDPKKSFLYMERYVNDGSPSGFTWLNQTSNNTTPRSNNEYFFLDQFYSTNIDIIGKRPVNCLFGNNILYIHPDMNIMYCDDFCIQHSGIRVCATSSSRTVKLLDYPGFIKLNYNGIIGRIDRSLTNKHASASVELTNYLKKSLGSKLYSNLAFFPEPFANFYNDPKKNINIGMVYREEQPFGLASSNISYIIPLFSLFSLDQKRINDELLLIQLVLLSNEDPVTFILERIIFPIIDNYFKLIINEGLQPEWHSQNLLLGLNADFSEIYLIMRDLESIDIDQTIREGIGKSSFLNCFPYKHINSTQYNYSIKHSFMYDYKIGEYVFTPLINCIDRHFHVDIKMVENAIKHHANAYIRKLPHDFFPNENEWYSFENIIIDRSTSKRPYKKNKGIKYR